MIESKRSKLFLEKLQEWIKITDPFKVRCTGAETEKILIKLAGSHKEFNDKIELSQVQNSS